MYDSFFNNTEITSNISSNMFKSLSCCSFTLLFLSGCCEYAAGTTNKIDSSSSSSDSLKNIVVTEDDAEVVELPVVLQSVKSFTKSLKLGDPASLEESQKTIKTLQDLSNKYIMSSEDKFLGLSKFDGSSESLKHDLDQIHELIVSMSFLEDAMSQDTLLSDSVPMDKLVGAAFRDVAPIIANARSALSDIVDIVKEKTGVESSFKDKDAKSTIDVASTRNLMMEDMSNSNNHTNSSSPISKTEFEFRARGYEGFMAEDQSRDPILHSNVFTNFEFLNDDFATFMESNSYENGAGRRLNDEGACVTPNENDLKNKRCARLLSCAKEYTLYGEII